MTETEKAWCAGFIEATSLRCGERNNGGKKYRKWSVATTRTVKGNTAWIKKLAKLSGMRVYECVSRAFGESFTTPQGREAVYTDHLGTKFVFSMSGYQAQKFINEIKEYLQPETVKRFQALLDHEFDMNRVNRKRKYSSPNRVA